MTLALLFFFVRVYGDDPLQWDREGPWQTLQECREHQQRQVWYGFGYKDAPNSECYALSHG